MWKWKSRKKREKFLDFWSNDKINHNGINTKKFIGCPPSTSNSICKEEDKISFAQVEGEVLEGMSRWVCPKGNMKCECGAQSHVIAININLVVSRRHTEGKSVGETGEQKTHKRKICRWDCITQKKAPRRKKDQRRWEIKRQTKKEQKLFLQPRTKATLLDDLCKGSSFPISFQLKSLSGILSLSSSLIYTLFSFGLSSIPPKPFWDRKIWKSKIFSIHFYFSNKTQRELVIFLHMASSIYLKVNGQSNNINAYHFLTLVWILTLTLISSYH